MTKEKKTVSPHHIAEGKVKVAREENSSQSSMSFRAYRVWWKALPDYRPIIGSRSRGVAKKYLQNMANDADWFAKYTDICAVRIPEYDELAASQARTSVISATGVPKAAESTKTVFPHG